METSWFPTCDSNVNPEQTKKRSNQDFIKILFMKFSSNSRNDFTLHREGTLIYSEINRTVSPSV